jgi:PAS domain-containing protein
LAGIYHAKDVELFERPGTQTYETQVKDARGVLHDVVFYKATMTNSRGKVTGLIGTILDITDRKQAENALKKSEERYRTVFETTGSATIIVEEDTTISLVKEALSEVEKQHEKLKLTQSKLVQSEKMAGIGTMAAGVAHEINNPTNYVYLSSKTLEKDLSDFKKELLDMMSANDDEIS